MQPTTAKLAPRMVRGLTFIELLIVIAILAVLVTLSVPWAGALIGRQQQRVAVSTLHDHLALARSTAISRGRRTALSPVTAGDWSRGWRVYVDANRNGEWDEDDEPMVAQAGATQAAISTTGTLDEYVAFDASGRPVQESGAFLAGTFSVCGPAGDTTLRVVLNAAGRASRSATTTPCGS
jgi:type IV fimbrial biogenesis protein FimT